MKEDNQTTRESVVLDQNGDDEPVEKIVPRAHLITMDEKVAASMKTPKPTCKECVKLEAMVTKLEGDNAALKKKIDELKKSLEGLRTETKRKITELKGKKRDDSAAKLDKPSGTKRVGDKSEPHLGFYWLFRKAAKPYGIFATDTAAYGTAALCECNSESEALQKIHECANDEAKAKSATA